MSDPNILSAGRYTFDDVQTGDKIETGSTTITAKLIDDFAALTGDRFVIHMDVDAAKRLGFSGRVAHGLLILSVIDGLKNNAPAQFDAVASLGWDWKFSAPVLADDIVRTEITVLSKRSTKNPERGILELGFMVFNQRNELVQQGNNTLMVCR